jgi:hypothetical protein
MAVSKVAGPSSRPSSCCPGRAQEAAVAKYMPQLQHNMWVVAARSAVLSVITGGGKWVEITTHADPLYQHLFVTAERKFWRWRGERQGARSLGSRSLLGRKDRSFSPTSVPASGVNHRPDHFAWVPALVSIPSSFVSQKAGASRDCPEAVLAMSNSNFAEGYRFRNEPN